MNDVRKILVTGAAGNVGGAVVRALLAHNLEVVGGTTRPETAVFEQGVTAVKADFTDPVGMAAAMKGVDGLFLVAPPMDLEAPAKLNPVIDQAWAGGVKHIVFHSALGVDQDETAPLRVIENHLMASGVDYTIVRPNFFMENFSTGFFASMIEQGGIYLAAADSQTSFISTDDIASVVATAFVKGLHGKAYNLTGPAALDHGQVAAMISEVSGKSVQYHALTEEAMFQGMRDQGMPEGAITYMGILYNAVRSGWMAVVTDDVRQVTGRPAISFGEFAEKSVQHWR